jgi:hypothetical protein
MAAAIKGGAYGPVRRSNKGGQVHHTPSMGSYKIAGIKMSQEKGPSLHLPEKLHRRLVSTGSSNEAVMFRCWEATLLLDKQPDMAQQLSFDNILEENGPGMEGGMKQASGYAKAIELKLMPPKLGK